MSQTTPTSPTVVPDKAEVAMSASDQDDPLAHLYKMSRTAGLGSGDYVAINPVAVTALVFGISGALLIVDSLFILLPVVGLILGIIAFRQVRRSNGTQTGAAMAALAILLSIGFLGAKVAKETIQSIQLSADKQEITRIMDVLGQNLSAIDPAKLPETQAHLSSSYDLFDEAFKSRVTREHFDTIWIKSRPYYGPMSSLHSNGLLKFETDPRSGDMVCTSIGVAEFQQGAAARWAMVFRQLSGKWFIDNMPDLFPAEPPARGPSQPQPQ